jgi:phage shock protein A
VSQAAGGANYTPDYENGENVFDYINKRTTQQSRAKEKDIDLKKYTRVELEKKHHELLKTLAEVKVQIEKYDMSYQRNIGRDPTTAAEVKKQLEALHEQFQSVGRQEKLLRTKLEMKKNRAKMKEY